MPWHRWRPDSWRGHLWSIGIALGSVAAAAVVVLLLPRALWLPSGALVFLMAVLGAAALAGRVGGVTAAITSFLVFDFLFTEPRYTLTISDPNEWIALLAYLTVATVVSQLVALQRDHVLDAESREREARLLHDLTDLLAGRSFRDALSSVAERLRDELGADGVVLRIESADAVAGYASAGESTSLPGRGAGTARTVSVLGEGEPASADRSGSPGRWVRVAPAYRPPSAHPPATTTRVPIGRGSETVGQLWVQWPRSVKVGAREARLLDTAAGQLAVATEREALRTRAMEAEVLRRTSELKSALLDAVSHDLRTPLAGIIGAAGSIRQTDVDWTDAERAEFAETIEQEAERLNRIVGNLLDLSRIQGGTLHPARAWHDPARVLHDSAERLRASAATHRFVVSVPDELPPAFVDAVELDQVVANLVENAIKHTPSGGEVRLTAKQDDHVLEVAVEDRGPGIPVAAMAHLFEPFYRVPGATRGHGTGLGLAVARGLVEAHGGRIHAENRSAGGARFVFTIPSPDRPEEDRI